MHEKQCPRSVNATKILVTQSSVNKLGNIKIFSGWNTKSQWNAKSHFNICARIIQYSRISAPNTISNFMNSRKNNFSSFFPIIQDQNGEFSSTKFSKYAQEQLQHEPRIFNKILNTTQQWIQDFPTTKYIEFKILAPNDIQH